MNSLNTKFLTLSLALMVAFVFPSTIVMAAPGTPYAANSIAEEPVNTNAESTATVQGAVKKEVDWPLVLTIITPVLLTVIFQLLLLRMISRRGLRPTKPNIA